jgi:hypothetical protein
VSIQNSAQWQFFVVQSAYNSTVKPASTRSKHHRNDNELVVKVVEVKSVIRQQDWIGSTSRKSGRLCTQEKGGNDGLAQEEKLSCFITNGMGLLELQESFAQQRSQAFRPRNTKIRMRDLSDPSITVQNNQKYRSVLKQTAMQLHDGYMSSLSDANEIE